MNAIQKFIKDNNIDLTDSGSGFNASCAVLAGFALYLNDDTDDVHRVLDDIEENGLYNLNGEQEDEFTRVFNHAYINNYRDFWTEPDAQSKYIFELKKEDKK